ncbi:ZIP family metal transporter [Nocardioides sp. GXQ0305]|uniref:ZIP family metal transporter n=1 Tax=Nocardioides sp. GXQ0305 TaxID=3423912 RepID=UPI003D7E62E6
MSHALLLAFALTVLAGAATALGGVVAVHRAVRSDAGLAAALGFAAGAMILVSAAEILPKGAAALAPSVGHRGGLVATLGLAAVGAAAAVLLGRLVPGSCAHDRDPLAVRRQVRRSGVVVAIAVTAHNFPEGLATFVATLDDPSAGAVLAVAIALHNVPEGVAVAAPVFGAGGSRARAVAVAGLTGLAEPVGAALGYLLLVALFPASAFGAVFGLVAGVMLCIGLSELLPAACRLTSLVPALTTCVAGGASMALSLVLLGLA